MSGESPSASGERPGPPDVSGPVLVTGGGGFVGSAVVRALVREAEVDEEAMDPDGSIQKVAAVLRPGGSDERLADLAPSPRWSIERTDLADAASLGALLRRLRPVCVIHTALDGSAHASRDAVTRRDHIERPLEALFRSLEGVPGARLISTGSAAVLAPGKRIDEQAPVEPNPAYPVYAEHKLREERLAARLSEDTGVSWFHLRLFYLFGRYEAPDRLLPYLVRRLSAGARAELSAGHQVRDYTDVDEAANAYVRAIRADGEHSGIYHIGSGRGLSIRDFAHTVADVVGGRSLLRFGAAPAADEDLGPIIADPGRARRRLGWSASPETRDRIGEAATWWLERLKTDPSVSPT